MQEGDDGDGKEPKPEEEIELLVHNVVRKNAHSVEVCFMAPTAKLYKEGKLIKEYGDATESYLSQVARGDDRECSC